MKLQSSGGQILTVNYKICTYETQHSLIQRGAKHRQNCSFLITIKFKNEPL